MKRALVIILMGAAAVIALAQFAPTPYLLVNGSGVPFTNASGVGQLNFAPAPMVPYCTSTGSAPYFVCTFSGGGGGDTITSPNSTLTVGGTSTATTLDFNLAHANTWTGIQTFTTPALGTPGSGVITNLTGTCLTCVANSAGSVTNAVTFNNSNSGAASGSTYNGSAAVTVSSNTLGDASLANPNTFTGAGAASTSQMLLNGTWFTTGSSSTNYPALYVKQSGATDPNFSTSGEGFDVNAATGFTGHLAQFCVGGTCPFIFGSTGTLNATGNVKALGFQNSNSCLAVGTAANPSVANCGAGAYASGYFSCATNASTGTCTVDTTTPDGTSVIIVQQTSATKVQTALQTVSAGLTCNTAVTADAKGILSNWANNGSFTINPGTYSTNPACFVYWIID